MKGITSLLAILAIACFVGTANAGDLEDLAKKNTEVKTSKTFETHCGGSGGFSSRGFASGGCGTGGFASGGCGVGSRGPSFSPQAPSFSGPDVVPTPEPVNSTASLKGEFLNHTVGKPTLDGQGVSGDAENHCVRPATVLVPVRPVPVRPVLVPAAPAIVGVPTNKGYFYTERRLGLLGLRGRVVQYHEYGGN